MHTGGAAAGSAPLSADRMARLVYRVLPVPMCVLDGSGALIGMNPRAEAFWATSAADVCGAPAAEVLRIGPPGEGGTQDVVGAALRTGVRVPCRIADRAGRTHVASLVGLAVPGDDAPHSLLVVVDERTAQVLEDPPAWALQDPATGLANRHRWDREAPSWNARAGTVVFFDLDDLKALNDLYGHRAGDRALLLAARSITAELPAGEALAVRHGGDEFLVVLEGATVAQAEAFAHRAEERLVREAAAAELPLIPRLSHGTAPFPPGGLEAGTQQADEALYERRGVLLRASGGGRLILTREGRQAVTGPGEGGEGSGPGAFASGFSPEFDRYFRAQYARATEQAEGFVRFVAPEPGSAAVEVGAGSGRITFDGGLAGRIGSGGRLLVTDPSTAQLQAARRRAHRLGMAWLRFLPAPAERLPLASGTADLVLGAVFLHFTDPGRALREMARLVRPGGRVAVSTMLEFVWPEVWWDILQPVREELGRHGLPFRHAFPSASALRGHLADGGLRLERSRIVGPEPWEFPDIDLALPLTRQIGLVSLLLRGVPAERHDAVRLEVEDRMRTAFARTTPAERFADVQWMDVVACRPG